MSDNYNSTDNFDIDRCLNRDDFSLSYLVTPKLDKLSKYHLKKFNLTELKKKGLDEKCRNLHLQMKLLKHPNMVRIYGAFEEGSEYSLVMDSYEEDMATYLKRRVKKDSEAFIRKLAKQLSGAIKHLHERQILHGNIKPQNVFKDGDLFKIGEIALAVDEKDVAYSAPEQLRGEPVGLPYDLWCLGVLLYEIATGRTPFANLSEVIMKASILNESPAPFNDSQGYSPSMVDFIISLLVKDQKLRVDAASVCSNKWLTLESSNDLIEEELSSYRVTSSLTATSFHFQRSNIVKLESIRASKLINGKLKRRLCLFLQAERVSSDDLLNCSQSELKTLFRNKDFLEAIVRWRSAYLTELAESKLKDFSKYLIDWTKDGDLDSLRHFLKNEILPLLSRIAEYDDKEHLRHKLGQLLTKYVQSKSYGAKLLHYASHFGHLSIVQFLVIECGMSITVKLNGNWFASQPIHMALFKGHLSVVKWFCDYYPWWMVEARRLDGLTLMHLAAMFNKPEFIIYLVDHYKANIEALDNYGRPPIFFAVVYGHISVVILLIENFGAKYRQSNVEDGFNLIHVADHNEHPHIAKYLFDKWPDSSDILNRQPPSPLVVQDVEFQSVPILA